MSSSSSHASSHGAPARARRTRAVGPDGRSTLRHWSDAGSCWTRSRRADGEWTYRDEDGRRVVAPADIDRVRRIFIPPAWTDVCICPHENGHVQATGRDARGRKQFRYHPAWTARRSDTKFGRLLDIAQVLPKVRRRVQQALAEADRPRGRVPTKTMVMAAIVRLLDTTWLRIGNDVYARRNRSFGLSTLRRRHVQTSEDKVRLSFVGKSGVRHDVALDDAKVADVVRRCRELPGQELFQFVDDDGEVRRVDSGDVNGWLQDVSGFDLTAKDFRTWHGSVLALQMATQRPSDDAKPLSVSEVVRRVAQCLGNTPAVCRKSYVHPRVLALCELLGAGAGAPPSDDRAARWIEADVPAAPRGLSKEERRLLAVLKAEGGQSARASRPSRRGPAKRSPQSMH